MLPDLDRQEQVQNTIGLLQRRGFLVEKSGNDYFLSDNSDPDDRDYLSEILCSLNVGYMDKEYIIITDDNPDRILSLFEPIPVGSIGVGSCNMIQPWYKMNTRFCAQKIPVRVLEPNIAYYIKALSACGIYTGGCCDGNHPGKVRLYIEFDGPAYKDLHKCIWESLLVDKYPVSWDQDYISVDLRRSRQCQYDQIYLAADFFYRNRQQLRWVRMDSSSWINKKIIRKYSSDTIKKRFIEEVKRNLTNRRDSYEWL